MKTAFIFSAAVTMVFSGAASAGVVLWDQQPDGEASAFVDQNFGDFPDFSTFLVSDIVFGGGVVINSITTYYSLNPEGSGWPQNAGGFATLNIFADPLSGADNPLGGTSVAVSYSTSGDTITVTASGLNIALAAGTYWIGLTPELDFVAKGQEFHRGALVSMGAATQGRNPGGGFGLGPDWFDAGFTFAGIKNWDASITIEGIPAPGALALLGLAGLVSRRRRRS